LTGLTLPVLTQEQIPVLTRSVGNYTHSVSSSQTQALRRNVRGLVLFDVLPDIVRFLNCLKRNFEVNQDLNYGTLLKIMVEIYYNINRAQTVFYTETTVDNTRHKSFLMGNAAMCHGANII